MLVGLGVGLVTVASGGVARAEASAGGSGEVAPKSPWRPWPLFDPYLSPRERGLTVGRLVRRATGRFEPDPALRIGYGQTISTQRGLLLARGSVEESVRFSEAGHVVIGLRGYDLGAGVSAGPASIEAHVGLRLLELHVGRDGFGGQGFGIGGLTPSTGVATSVRVGGLRLALSAHAELAHRWFSRRPAEPILGVTLGAFVGGKPTGLPSVYELSPAR